MKSLPAVLVSIGVIILVSFATSFGITFSNITHQAHLDNYPTCRASAWFDYDRDGFLDLLIGSEDGANRLHKNLGNGTFSNVTTQSHIPQRAGIWGVNFADIDNDWYQEIYLSVRAPDTFSAGRNVLLYNTGQGSFVDISDSSCSNVPGGGVAACFAPFSKGPYLDIFVPNQYYPSQEYPYFLRNNGNATFSDITAMVGLYFRDWWDIPIAFDYDNDNRLELFCTKDYHGNSMYDQPLGMAFIDISESLNFQTPCGYGATVGDINNDGWFDLYVTNWHEFDDNLFLYDTTNQQYENITQGWNAPGLSWTSAAHFADFDNDGWLDLFITGAGVGNKYYGNTAGTGFVDQTSQVGLINNGYNSGTSIADYDNDGFLDIFVPEYYQGNGGKLYRNNGNNNNWVNFELEGRNSNRDGIGAKLILETASFTQTSQVIAGSGFGSQNTLIQHFGLGQDSIINRLTVFWPNRGFDIYESLGVNTSFHVIEGEALSTDTKPVNQPIEFKISKVYPNPFNNQVQIELLIGKECNLSVKIVDILGRKVNTLMADNVIAGTKILTWDGRDQAGASVSSGIYFCLVAGGKHFNSQKLLLLK
jgi:enediyne biosynthesis protein E4